MTNINVSDNSIAQPNSVTPTTPPGKQAVGEENVEQKATPFSPVEESAKAETNRARTEDDRRKQALLDQQRSDSAIAENKVKNAEAENVARQAAAERQKTELDQQLLRKIAARDQEQAIVSAEASESQGSAVSETISTEPQAFSTGISESAQKAVDSAQSLAREQEASEERTTTLRDANNEVLEAKQRVAEARLTEGEASDDRAAEARAREASAEMREALNEQRKAELAARQEVRAEAFERDDDSDSEESEDDADSAETEVRVQTNGVDEQVIEDVYAIESNAALAAEVFKNVSLEAEVTEDPFVITDSFTIDVEA